MRRIDAGRTRSSGVSAFERPGDGPIITSAREVVVEDGVDVIGAGAAQGGLGAHHLHQGSHIDFVHARCDPQVLFSLFNALGEGRDAPGSILQGELGLANLELDPAADLFEPVLRLLQSDLARLRASSGV